jgi:hypothetical protein
VISLGIRSGETAVLRDRENKKDCVARFVELNVNFGLAANRALSYVSKNDLKYHWYI